jgi:hypothetical protein
MPWLPKGRHTLCTSLSRRQSTYALSVERRLIGRHSSIHKSFVNRALDWSLKTGNAPRTPVCNPLKNHPEPCTILSDVHPSEWGIRELRLPSTNPAATSACSLSLGEACNSGKCTAVPQGSHRASTRGVYKYIASRAARDSRVSRVPWATPGRLSVPPRLAHI